MYKPSYKTLLTVRDLIRYSVSCLKEAGVAVGHGSDNFWDEAVYLVLYSLHLPPDVLEPFLDARVLPQERDCVLDLLTKRIKDRIPSAYLTNEGWLRGRCFYVDQRTIVPRSSIAALLDDRLEPWVTNPNHIRTILDMCTGSGCLAILAAQNFPDAYVEAIDISYSALEVAQYNVTSFCLENRVFLQQGNLFSCLAEKSYDLIICNPPYVGQEVMETLPEEYLCEPRLALEGGKDGMDLIGEIIKKSGAFLNPKGLLVLEVGQKRSTFEMKFQHLQPIWLNTVDNINHVVLLQKEQLLAIET